jgi:subtilisin family serine protease
MTRLTRWSLLILLLSFIIAIPLSSTAAENMLKKYGPLKPPKNRPDLSTIKEKIQAFKIKKSLENRKISSRLNSLISNKKARKEQMAKSRISRAVTEEVEREKIRVVFKTKGNLDEISDAIIARGGKMLRGRKDSIVAEVPFDKIEDMVDSIPGVEYARLPNKLFPIGTTSEGVALTGAGSLHSSGYTGSGVKVAVIDIGFMGLIAAKQSGDIPSNVITEDFTGLGLEHRFYHGTACAEIIHDMAPDAQLYLIKIGDDTDLEDVLDYCIANNIKIVSVSLGTFGSGPGDGTGEFDEAIDEFRANGILVIAAAGNEGSYTEVYQGNTYTHGYHWEGTFNDSDADLQIEFIPGNTDSWYNVLAAVPYTDDEGTPLDDDVTVVMRWDDNWSGSSIDYDIYLFDYNTKKIVAGSTEYQTGTQPPLEGFIWDIPDSEDVIHLYDIYVKRDSLDIPVGIKLEIYLSGTSMFIAYPEYDNPYSAIATPSSSITEPADAESVLAVGAIDYANWTAGPQEEFSSQGPTNDWGGSSSRIKPDISGPDGVSGYAYSLSPDHGPFYGTSAAAPHVAGAAALILSMYPNLRTDELRHILESKAIDMGEAGKDNIYGWGRLDLTGEIEKPVRDMSWLPLLLNE